MVANKMLSATVAVLSFLASGVQPSIARQTDSVLRSDSRVQLRVCAKEAVWENRTFQQAGWKATIALDPCVPESHAIRILQAIEHQNLVNAQTVNPSTGSVPAVPRLRLSQVESIGTRFVTGERVDRSDVGPSTLYEVRTRSVDSPLRGLSLRVSIRDGDVEVQSVGAWLE